jgi:hypothetical protein
MEVDCGFVAVALCEGQKTQEGLFGSHLWGFHVGLHTSNQGIILGDKKGLIWGFTKGSLWALFWH